MVITIIFEFYGSFIHIRGLVFVIDISDGSIDLVTLQELLDTRHGASELEVLTDEKWKASHGIPDLIENKLNCKSSANLHGIAHIYKSYDGQSAHQLWK